jgi:hypothetical protein
MSPLASMSSLRLYANDNRLFNTKPPQEVSQDLFKEEFSSILENVVAVQWVRKFY